MLKNPYQAYKQQSVMTMTPGDMLQMLYDESIKELNAAKLAIQNKKYSEANHSLQKVQRIFNHLKSSLDFKYDIAKNLEALYDYFIRQIVDANIKKNEKAIDEILPMIAELKDSYAQADKLSRMKP